MKSVEKLLKEQGKKAYMRRRLIIIVLILVVIICAGLAINRGYNSMVDGAADKGEVKITNINIYKNTPALELVLAMKNEKTSTIEKIAKNKPELLNY